MSFWSVGFWVEGFWSTGFWGSDAAAAEVARPAGGRLSFPIRVPQELRPKPGPLPARVENDEALLIHLLH